MSQFPHDTDEHLATVALDLFDGNTMLAIAKLEGAAEVLKRWKRLDLWTSEMVTRSQSPLDRRKT